jgi:TolA-binding protein
MKKTVLMISIFLTIFVLGIVAAVGKVVADSRQPAAASTAEVQQVLAQRDAEYSQLIDQANQRLQDANQTIDTLNNQIQAIQPTGTSKPGYVQLQDASNTAMAAVGAGASLAKIPDLVDYQGGPAYEVTMADGAVVYVDAMNGLVLYNSLTGDATAVINPDQAAAAAVAYMKGGKVVSVERTMVKEVAMYKVVFSTAAQVFVDMRGQVAYVKMINNVASNPPATSSNSGSSGQSSGGGHESDDHGGDD